MYSTFVIVICARVQIYTYTVGPGLANTDLSENLSYPKDLHRKNYISGFYLKIYVCMGGKHHLSIDIMTLATLAPFSAPQVCGRGN